MSPVRGHRPAVNRRPRPTTCEDTFLSATRMWHSSGLQYSIAGFGNKRSKACPGGSLLLAFLTQCCSLSAHHRGDLNLPDAYSGASPGTRARDTTPLFAMRAESGDLSRSCDIGAAASAGYMNALDPYVRNELRWPLTIQCPDPLLRLTMEPS